MENAPQPRLLLIRILEEVNPVDGLGVPVWAAHLAEQLMLVYLVHLLHPGDASCCWGWAWCTGSCWLAGSAIAHVSGPLVCACPRCHERSGDWVMVVRLTVDYGSKVARGGMVGRLRECFRMSGGAREAFGVVRGEVNYSG